MTARILGASDEQAIAAFLRAHADSSMTLWSNLLRAGAAPGLEMYQGTWVGMYQGTKLAGVAAQMWNGHLLLQAPQHAGELARLACQRKVTGILGPWAQATQAREALGLRDAGTRVDEREELMAIDLSLLREPPRHAARAATEADLDAVIALREAFARELNLEKADPQRLRESTRAALGKADIFITIDGDRPVAMSGLNARLPDRLQIAGVYTPPELRGRGYAKSAVAAQLAAARDAGMVRATLFTRANNLPALACYRALGFSRVGDYALILFQE